MTSIGDYAFYWCWSLTSITIPDSVTSIGDYAFSGCGKLTKLIIADGSTSISSVMVVCKEQLTEIVIPDSVTSIGDDAFRGCSSLTSITISEGVTSIGDDAFYDTAYYNDESNWENGVLYINNHLIKANRDLSGEYKIKDGTRTIAGSAFFGCSNLKRITIPDSVTSIGDSAFGHCSSLTSITIPDSVTSIGDSAFGHCSSLTSITIPDNVTSIGGWAFSYCSNLTSITIPDSVTSIEGYAFSWCDSLTDVYYGGTEEEWDQITISEKNDSLKNAVIHFTGHTHFYIEKADAEFLKTPATCNNKAVYFKSCSICGKKGTETFEYGEFDSSNHVGEIHIIDEKKPTYTECGETVYKCELCGGTYTEIVPVLPLLRGDASGDGKINMKDVLMVRKAVAKVLTLSDEEKDRADVTKDGLINLKDVLLLRKVCAGIAHID